MNRRSQRKIKLDGKQDKKRKEKRTRLIRLLGTEISSLLNSHDNPPILITPDEIFIRSGCFIGREYTYTPWSLLDIYKALIDASTVAGALYASSGMPILSVEAYELALPVYKLYEDLEGCMKTYTKMQLVANSVLAKRREGSTIDTIEYNLGSYFRVVIFGPGYQINKEYHNNLQSFYHTFLEENNEDLIIEKSDDIERKSEKYKKKVFLCMLRNLCPMNILEAYPLMEYVYRSKSRRHVSDFQSKVLNNLYTSHFDLNGGKKIPRENIKVVMDSVDEEELLWQTVQDGNINQVFIKITSLKILSKPKDKSKMDFSQRYILSENQGHYKMENRDFMKHLFGPSQSEYNQNKRADSSALNLCISNDNATGKYLTAAENYNLSHIAKYKEPNDICLLPQGSGSIKENDLNTIEAHDNMERGCNVFYYSTPFTRKSKDGKSKMHGSTVEQYKRTIYISVPEKFPCALSRQIVTGKCEKIKTPIECALEDVQSRCIMIKELLSKNLETIRSREKNFLMQLLQGSVLPQVHGGALEVAQVFLNLKMEASSFEFVRATKVAKTQTVEDNGTNVDIDEKEQNEITLSLEEFAEVKRRLQWQLIEFLDLCLSLILLSREVLGVSITSTSHTNSSNAAKQLYFASVQTQRQYERESMGSLFQKHMKALHNNLHSNFDQTALMKSHFQLQATGITQGRLQGLKAHRTGDSVNNNTSIGGDPTIMKMGVGFSSSSLSTMPTSTNNNSNVSNANSTSFTNIQHVDEDLTPIY